MFKNIRKFQKTGIKISKKMSKHFKKKMSKNVEKIV